MADRGGGGGGGGARYEPVADDVAELPRSDVLPLLGGGGDGRSDAAAAEAGAGARRPSVVEALARQNAPQRARHARRMANHPLAPAQATLGRTICATLFKLVLVVVVVVAFWEDGFHLQRITPSCARQLAPIGLWLKVLVVFPAADVIPPWLAYCCGEEYGERFQRLIETCACCNFLGRLGWLILGTSWLLDNDELTSPMADGTPAPCPDGLPMVFVVARFVIVLCWSVVGLILLICCCMLPCLIYLMSQEEFVNQLALLQQDVRFPWALSPLLSLDVFAQRGRPRRKTLSMCVLAQRVAAADKDTIENIAKGVYRAPAAAGQPGKIQVPELKYEAEVPESDATDCISLLEYASARFCLCALSGRADGWACAAGGRGGAVRAGLQAPRPGRDADAVAADQRLVPDLPLQRAAAGQGAAR